jgi:RNA polymerase sigma-70 factor (ECF subfamily)
MRNIDIEEYYKKYCPMVLRRCRWLLKDEDKALDAMQDVFVLLLRNRDRLKGNYPSSLLYRIATNVCLNIIRYTGKMPFTLEEIWTLLAIEIGSLDLGYKWLITGSPGLFIEPFSGLESDNGAEFGLRTGWAF